jgi:hypothetical protein
MCQWILVVENSRLCGSEVAWVHATCGERPVRCSGATTIPRPLEGEDTVVLKEKGGYRLNKSTGEVSGEKSNVSMPSGTFRDGRADRGETGRQTGHEGGSFRGEIKKLLEVVLKTLTIS